MLMASWPQSNSQPTSSPSRPAQRCRLATFPSHSSHSGTSKWPASTEPSGGSAQPAHKGGKRNSANGTTYQAPGGGSGTDGGGPGGTSWPSRLPSTSSSSAMSAAATS